MEGDRDPAEWNERDNQNCVTKNDQKQRRKKKKKRSKKSGQKIPQQQDDLSEDDKQKLLDFVKTGLYKFDKDSCSSNVTCQGNSAQRHVCKQSTDGARGLIGIQDGTHVFQFDFDNLPWGSHCSIGLVTGTVPLQAPGYSHLFGSSPEAWGFDIPSLISHHDNQQLELLTKAFIEDIPRTLSLVVNRNKRRLSLVLGNQEHVLFTDLPEPSIMLFPAVSMVYGMARVHISLVKSTLYAKYNHLTEKAVADSQDHVEDHGDEDPMMKDNLNNKEHPLPDINDGTEEDTEMRDKEDKEITGKEENQSDPECRKDVKRDCLEGNEKDSEEHLENEVIETSEHALVTGTDEDANIVTEEGSQIKGDEVETNNITENEAEGLAGEDKHDQDGSIHDEVKVESNEEVPSFEKWKQEKSVSQQDQEGQSWNDKLTQDESSDDEEEADFEQETCTVSNLSDDDQYLIRLAHSWDFINRGSLIQPYPNVPYICVPMPNLLGKAQGVRCRCGFEDKGIHSWKIKQLTMFSPTAHRDYNVMKCTKENNVIIGIASSDQRKFNFGYTLTTLGSEFWGIEIPGLRIHNGNSVTELGKVDVDIDLTEGIEFTLNTVTHKLSIVFRDCLIAEISKVKGDCLYPFTTYKEEAYWPIEITYLSGPQEYVDGLLTKMHEVSLTDFDGVNNVRVLNKRSSSTREHRGPDGAPEKYRYIWGCHSSEINISKDKTQASCDSSLGIVAAHFPLSDSRHNIRFSLEGSFNGLCFGLLHGDYDMNQVSRGHFPATPNPAYLGNDLYSWCWNVQNGLTYHGGRVIGRYPVDIGFDASEISGFTLTLNFTTLNYNTAAITAHYRDKKRPPKELGIVFVSLPAKVLPAVSMSGQNQSVKMEYISGPWKGGQGTSSLSEDLQSESKVCVIL